MAKTNLQKLAELLKMRQDDVMQMWRAKVRQVPAARRLNKTQLDDHIRILLDDLADVLSKAPANTHSDDAILRVLRVAWCRTAPPKLQSDRSRGGIQCTTRGHSGICREPTHRFVRAG